MKDWFCRCKADPALLGKSYRIITEPLGIKEQNINSSEKGREDE